MSNNAKALQWIGDVTPATERIAREIVDHLDDLELVLPDYPAPYDGPVMHGVGTSSEHATDRALDVMVNNNTRAGDAVAAYVWKHRDRFDLIHIIWRQRIKSTVVSPGKWRRMDDRGGPTENHMDHPHLFFGTNALAGSSTGGAQAKRPTKKKKSSSPKAPAFPLPHRHYFGPRTGPVLSVSGYYSHRSHLRRWQQRMADRGWAITADGLYGPVTARIARQFQAEKGLVVDGLIGPATWDAAWTEPIT